jgi:hypothetical protein
MSHLAARGSRLLVDFSYGSGRARLLSRCPVGRSFYRLPTDWCGSHLGCGPAGRRGEAWLKRGLPGSK